MFTESIVPRAPSCRPDHVKGTDCKDTTWTQTPVSSDTCSETRRRFIVSIVRDGVTLTQIGVMFDEEPVERAEWVGRGADGFPIQEGKMIEVIGKHLIIRRAFLRLADQLCDKVVTGNKPAPAV